jgi:cell division protein FtsB
MMLTLNRTWLLLFSLWLLFLSGVLTGFVGSPGVLQAVRLKNLLENKKTQLALIQKEFQKLQLESTQLETNPYAQIKEIRRVLGYAAPDEIIFDFTPTDQY